VVGLALVGAACGSNNSDTKRVDDRRRRGHIGCVQR